VARNATMQAQVSGIIHTANHNKHTTVHILRIHLYIRMYIHMYTFVVTITVVTNGRLGKTDSCVCSARLCIPFLLIKRKVQVAEVQGC
jgi:hypothetical protein